MYVLRQDDDGRIYLDCDDQLTDLDQVADEAFCMIIGNLPEEAQNHEVITQVLALMKRDLDTRRIV